MKSWTTATVDERCGNCRLPILVGDAVIVIRLAEGGPVWRRCVTCAARSWPELKPPPARDREAGEEG